MEYAQRFFDALDALGSGERATLRRSAGTRLQDAKTDALLVFYQCLPPEVSWSEGQWFAAGCLHCLWDATTTGSPMSLPAALRHMTAQEQMSHEAAMHRASAVMDTLWGNDGFLQAKITRLVRLVRQRGYRVDCKRLLEDMRYWNDDNQRIQRKWARELAASNTVEETNHVV